MWNFETFADNTAILDENGAKYSYGQLATICDELAKSAGGRRLVLSLCTNTPGSLIGYTAFLRGKIVPMMLDAHLDRTLLLSLIDIYKPDFLWLPADMKAAFADFPEICAALDYSLVRTGCDRAFPLHDELALLLTTSGSTGSPKFVRQSYVNIRANTEAIVSYLALDETERAITTLPMSYTYGLSILNSHLYVGASVIVTQKGLLQKEFWTQFRTLGATSFGGVPYIYEMLDKLRFFRMDVPTLRCMTQAGGKLSPALHKKFAEYAQNSGRRFFVMYGQTEATARMSYLPAENSLEKCGSIGVAIPGGAFSLRDADGGEILEAETVGELVYKGENVMLGYAETGADLHKGDERGGVLATGDLAKRDRDGFYYIVGRKKRFLKIFGSRVNLDETECLIQAAFPGGDFACAGRDDKMRVFLTDAAQADGVLKFLIEKTGFNRTAFSIAVIPAIPRNEAGKVLYSELRDDE
jgi:acyl-CoA synthetase (AMP-forming)/AMP-acid ligase II